MREANNIIMNYRVFVESTKIQVAGMEKVFNAQLLSRTGFVFEEIKDLEYRVGNDIEDRRRQVNNPACIQTATERLINASTIAGTNSQSAYSEIIQRVEFTRFLKIYPVLGELSRFVYGVAIEPFSLLSRFNPLTDFDSSIEALREEVDNFVELFEEFVDEIITEMTSLQALHQELSGILILSLEETRLQFSTSAREIRSFLTNECN